MLAMVVGRRSSSETIAAILVAFIRQPTWAQADLARHCGVSTRTVRRKLTELELAGMPFDRDEEAPHVYWSVPKGWLPGAVSLELDQAEAAARLLARLPATKLQASLLLLLRGPRASTAGARYDEAVVQHLEDGARQRVAVRFQYYSASSGRLSWRSASIHRIHYGDPARCLATCHRHDELRWFRVDRIQRAEIHAEESYQSVDEDELNRFARESISGFHGHAAAEESVFFVRMPEARWVVDTLPGPFPVQHLPNGIRVQAYTSALTELARFVVGLGAAATAESPGLRQEVLRLAAGATRANHGAPTIRSVRPIRPTGSDASKE